MKVFLKRIIKFILFPLNQLFYTLYINIFGSKVDKNKKYYISICAIFKDEGSYLKEWIEYNRIIGIQHFYLYNNFSSDNYSSVLEPYINNGIVTLIDWPVEQGQISAYEDCLEKFSKETSWLSFIDIDEFIVPKKHNDIKSFLHGFEKYPSIHLPWKMFGTSGKIERELSGLVCEDFTVCWNGFYEHKCIINTSYKVKNCFNLHQVVSFDSRISLPGIDQNKIFNFWGLYSIDNAKKIQINHYWSKSYNEYMKKISRGDAFFKENPRNTGEHFYFSEYKNTSVDFSIYKYLIKLKLAMSEFKK